MEGSTTYTITFNELNELTELVYKIYGLDLTGYAKASLKRRVTRLMHVKHLPLFDLRSVLINDPDFFDEFLAGITVNVTEMFRDPDFYKAFREKVLPYLASFQRIKIWNAGCSSGEELYSFAILLYEEQLYKRAFLYGTDINTRVIEQAKKGIYNLRSMKQYSENYQASGAIHSLSEYYIAKYDAACILQKLKKHTLFSVHNLVSDGVFNEFQVIVCRNVLIYFDIEQQQKIIDLFYNSLCMLGFLCLGSKESLRSDELKNRFRIIDRIENIYQKIA
ncbi:protein-glutamate O-methyltransferase CheR [Pedobacter sp. BS3]|uniref:CheR family methyltransferase n=1 Tax=Pedobacter sp. BS3 TaxID=2567937 RepID=UPI0011EDD32A|nr:protein-glutamate O-methyltransferase CheR [Pedobacter sp. BS3]TZF84033.1 protein-glutamate O-methyltransferase CheR [Pedobacter sp. BS3]